MSVLDKFLNVMKLNDDEDFGGDDYLDDPSEDVFDELPPEEPPPQPIRMAETTAVANNE